MMFIYTVYRYEGEVEAEIRGNQQDQQAWNPDSEIIAPGRERNHFSSSGRHLERPSE